MKTHQWGSNIIFPFQLLNQNKKKKLKDKLQVGQINI